MQNKKNLIESISRFDTAEKLMRLGKHFYSLPSCENYNHFLSSMMIINYPPRYLIYIDDVVFGVSAVPVSAFISLITFLGPLTLGSNYSTDN